MRPDIAFLLAGSTSAAALSSVYYCAHTPWLVLQWPRPLGPLVPLPRLPSDLTAANVRRLIDAVDYYSLAAR